MTHLRPEERESRRRSACRRGKHTFGDGQNIGAGILRRVCKTCAAVTIDLTHVYELSEPVKTHGNASFVTTLSRSS